MDQNPQIQAYFQRHASRFDRLYEPAAGLTRLANQWLRAPLYRRFDLTMAECSDVKGRHILDVGCGSGRYSVALAENGAKVLGIDFAGNMLNLAENLAADRGVSQRCRFVRANFLEYQFEEFFDISLAIGFFDYIEEPLIFLRLLDELTREKVIVTFPRPGGFRALQRQIRYQLQGCPIYFHSQQSMAELFAAAGFRAWRFVGSWAVAAPSVKESATSNDSDTNLTRERML